jgi:hypothetical protein
MGASIGYEGAPRRELVYECQCVYEGKAGPTCMECKGTGKVRFDSSEHELHVCYGTLKQVFRACGLGTLDEVCGSVDAVVFEYQLARVAAPENVPYYDTLLTIARAAVQAGKPLSWG